MGLPPISIMGFGLRCDSSEMRVPRPPARITAFIILRAQWTLLTGNAWPFAFSLETIS
jgi:hypothetical protein